MIDYALNIGKKVMKKSKPFKSGLLINTIKGVVPHPYTVQHPPAYTFEEDDSCVKCSTCIVIENDKNEETKEEYKRIYGGVI